MISTMGGKVTKQKNTGCSFRGVWILQTGCFFGKLPKGEGGVISDPKNYIADFLGFKTVYFGRKFWEKCPKS